MILRMKAFYRLVGVVYFVALLSLWIQFPGLVGNNGLLPAEVFVENVRNQQKVSGLSSIIKFNSLAFVAPDIFVTNDAWLEFLFWLGMLTSLCIAVGAHNSALFTIVWFCFRTMRDSFQTFTSFQWDMLLLECGFLCILSTPLLSFRVDERILRIYRWCFRFLAFKLMLQAGVVKLQSQCPTWEGLSALEFHFATQCLPTALAWFAHQLPPILLRLSVAATLIIEIPATILLIAPFVGIRRAGCMLQWLLQLMIFITGNYNYFNVLTSVLMIPCWLHDGEDDLHASDPPLTLKSTSNQQNSSPIELCSTLVSLSRVLDSQGIFAAWHSVCANFDRLRPVRKLEMLITICFLGLCCWYQISFHIHFGDLEWWRGERIQWVLPWSTLQRFLSGIAISSVVAVFLFMLCEWSHSARSIVLLSWKDYVLNKSVLRLLFGLVVWLLRWLALGSVAFTWLWLSSLTFGSITDVSPLRLVPVSQEWEDYASRLSGVSGYGLFRRMTGVGDLTAKNKRVISQRWNTSFVPSIVARPEVIIEGWDGQKWLEIEFRFKPGNLMVPPSLIAPLQPRLDWQMWFAALAMYQHNPWLVVLVLRLLHTASYTRDSTTGELVPSRNAILDLIDRDTYPFLSKPPAKIRALLYDYDFTRWNTSWSAPQNLISVDSLVPVPFGDVATSNYGIRKPSDSSHAQWWYRRNKREYLPELDGHNPSLQNFIKSQRTNIRSISQLQDPSIDHQYEECLFLAKRGSRQVESYFGTRKSWINRLMSFLNKVEEPPSTILAFQRAFNFYLASGIVTSLRGICLSLYGRQVIFRLVGSVDQILSTVNVTNTVGLSLWTTTIIAGLVTFVITKQWRRKRWC